MAEPKFQESRQDFCKDLIAAREYKDMDLMKVSERTKISPDYLSKLEAGDWDFLPGSYVRAFMRTYAQTVGMDVGEVLDRYDRIVGVAPTPQPAINIGDGGGTRLSMKPDTGSSRSPKFTLADDSSSGSSFTLTKPMLYGGIALIAVIVILLVYFFLIKPGGDGSSQNVEEIPFEEVVRESQMSDDPTATPADSLAEDEGTADSEPESVRNNQPADQREAPVETTRSEPEETAVTPAATGDRLTLTAEVTQPCYMRVITDHDTSNVFDTILSSGNTRVFDADSVFRVVIGNTNGVELMLNGRRLRNLGQRGRVVTLTIDRNGVREAQAGNQEL
ncbi:DUF4115 domain-containing protein [bacterium]|nr:DUF4115 domain-containing protein [bacterium]